MDTIQVKSSPVKSGWHSLIKDLLEGRWLAAFSWNCQKMRHAWGSVTFYRCNTEVVILLPTEEVYPPILFFHVCKYYKIRRSTAEVLTQQ